MTISQQNSLRVIRDTISGCLNPLYFTTEKLVWRRRLDDVLQQFALRKSQYGATYYAEWGLNVLSFDPQPKPDIERMNIRWSLVENVADSQQRMRYYALFKLGPPLPQELLNRFSPSGVTLPPPENDEVRANGVLSLMQEYVIPCFEACQTVEMTKAAILGPNRRYPAHINGILLEQLRVQS